MVRRACTQCCTELAIDSTVCWWYQMTHANRQVPCSFLGGGPSLNFMIDKGDVLTTALQLLTRQSHHNTDSNQLILNLKCESRWSS